MKIRELPKEIQELAISRQRDAGNCMDVDINIYRDRHNGGFTYDKTPEGYDFWKSIANKNFKPYYKKYGHKFKEGDLVVMTSDPDGVVDNGEIIKLGGQYWGEYGDINYPGWLDKLNRCKCLVAISRKSKKGNGWFMYSGEMQGEFRHATPGEINHYNRVGIGANINDVKDNLFKKGDLVVCDSKPKFWEDGEIIELGGKYWDEICINDIQSGRMIAAMCKEKPSGDAFTQNDLGNRFDMMRHATPEEVEHFNRVGRGANMNDMYKKKPESFCVKMTTRKEFDEFDEHCQKLRLKLGFTGNFSGTVYYGINKKGYPHCSVSTKKFAKVYESVNEWIHGSFKVGDKVMIREVSSHKSLDKRVTSSSETHGMYPINKFISPGKIIEVGSDGEHYLIEVFESKADYEKGNIKLIYHKSNFYKHEVSKEHPSGKRNPEPSGRRISRKKIKIKSSCRPIGKRARTGRKKASVKHGSVEGRKL